MFMNDDIMGLLFSTYTDATSASKSIKGDNDVITQMFPGLRTNADGTLYGTKGRADAERKEIEKIKKAEQDRYANLYKSELEYNKYSQKVKKDLLQQENKQYTELYNLKKKIHEKETTLLEEERNIRQEIANSGKVTLGDLASLYTKQQEIAKLEKETLEYKERQFKKGVDTVKQAFGTIIQHIMNYVNEWGNLLRWNQWEKGIKDSGTQYEQNFTEIAARLGSDTQMNTHDMLKSTLSSVIGDSVLKSGLNFNNEVFPAITDAVQKGFTTDAEDIAISNAIDKKIMPWLETSSETWVQMQYNMSDEALLRYKSDQLMLQATQEGNRLLQNGVISQITDSILPSLDNIVANTTEVEDLNDEMYAKVMYLMNDMGYSKQEAIKAVNKEIEAYQNPFKALTSGDTGDKLLAIDNLWGTDLVGNFASSMIGSGWAGSGAFFDLTGLASGGETRTERGLLTYAGMESAQNKYIKQYNLDRDNSSEYNISKLLEYTTATQQSDNKAQNIAANNTFDKNLQVHGIDLAALQLNELKEIKTWLITGLSVLLLTKLTDKMTDGFVKNVLSKFKTNVGGGSSSVGSGGALGTWSKGALSSGASTAAKITGFGAAALGTGVAIAGFSDMSDEIDFANNTNNLTIDRNEAKKDATTAGVAGALGAAGAAIGLFASGPIGLAIAAVGGLVLGVKKYNDHLEKVRDATETLTKGFTGAKEKIQEEHKAREDNLKSIRSNMLDLDSTSEKLEYLRESGLNPTITAEQLKGKTLEEVNKELDVYLSNLILENKKDSKEDQKNIDEIGGKLKTQYNKDVSELKDQIYGQLKGKSKDEQYEMLSMLGYSDEELDALFRNKANGAASDGELWRFLDKGGKFADVKGIESFSNKLGNGKITADDVNSFSNLYITHYNAPQLYDQTKLTADEISKIYTAAEYIYDYKAYGRSENPEKNNIPHEFKQTTYDEFKNYLTGLGRNFNTVVSETFKQLGYSGTLTPDSLSTSKEFRLGSSYIPMDMIAMLHAGERVLTAGQNKEYTNELTSGNSASSIIQAGVQDIVIAIKTQTTEIINYLSTVSFNNSSFGNSQINMLPAMGNTKVTI